MRSPEKKGRSKATLANRETLIWEEKKAKQMDRNLGMFYELAVRMHYEYFIAAYEDQDKIILAAACPNREELTEMLLEFTDMGFYCQAAKIEAEIFFGFEPN